MSATVETKVYTSFDAASLVNTQRQFFNTGKTKDVEFRIQQLKKLRQIIADNETAIVAALKADLNKSPMEAFATEFGFMLADIDHTLKDIRTLAKPRKVKTPLFHQLGSSWIQAEPFGCTYIIAPWNYPFQLALSPVVG
ncbi:MAG TPA: aldehyde dehydrogenase family protein, partial [Chitinophagales bacterium]|nr:aldehyde dehydrogenase family protein [Chitinophagales bacterium]HNL58519.1 aldehyde dehydrogenase family protein [Chitinophagales bacterium]HNN27395.1 aldehyde dehydrogenase family protein [Chitinophagales bacterium]HNO03526.1 aldehyde dehydrogenase family protein [Chitinophagales bacterium]